MFLKALKYDFLFSRTMFLGMAAVIVMLAAVIRFIVTPLTDGRGSLFGISYWLFFITVFVCGAMAVFQVMQIFYKNFFCDTGYLMLTLPVRRFPLLVSKVIVCFVWFNFMLAAIMIAMQAVDPNTFTFIWLIRFLLDMAEINLIAMFAALTIFFVITLAHSSLWRWRVHNAVAAAVGIAYAWLYVWVYTALSQWNREWEHIAIEGPYYTELRRITGLNTGVIAIGDYGAVFELFQFGAGFLLCVLTFIAIYYLLKKRVCL